jgi:hypothetical protein
MVLEKEKIGKGGLKEKECIVLDNEISVGPV